MTPADLRAALADLSLSQTALVQLTGAARSTVYRWLTGKLPVPGYVATIVSQQRAIACLDPPQQEQHNEHNEHQQQHGARVIAVPETGAVGPMRQAEDQQHQQDDDQDGHHRFLTTRTPAG